MNAYQFFLAKLAGIGGYDGTFSKKESLALIELLTNYHDQIGDYKHLIEEHHKRMAKSCKIYKRANKMPAYKYPDLSELLDWLLDRSGRKEAEDYKKALLKAYALLKELGMLTFDKKRTVEENYLIELRMVVQNAVDIPMPRIMGELAEMDKPSQNPEAGCSEWRSGFRSRDNALFGFSAGAFYWNFLNNRSAQKKDKDVLLRIFLPITNLKPICLNLYEMQSKLLFYLS